MGDQYNQVGRPSLDQSRSPYRVQHDVLKTTLTNNPNAHLAPQSACRGVVPSSQPPKPSPTGGYNPYSTSPQNTNPPQSGYSSNPTATPSGYPPTGYPQGPTTNQSGYTPTNGSGYPTDPSPSPYSQPQPYPNQAYPSYSQSPSLIQSPSLTQPSPYATPPSQPSNYPPNYNQQQSYPQQYPPTYPPTSQQPQYPPTSQQPQYPPTSQQPSTLHQSQYHNQQPQYPTSQPAQPQYTPTQPIQPQYTPPQPTQPQYPTSHQSQYQPSQQVPTQPTPSQYPLTQPNTHYSPQSSHISLSPSLSSESIGERDIKLNHSQGEGDSQTFRKNFSVIGGLKKTKSVPRHQQLVCYDPESVTREYPHLARGSFGIVYKGRVTGRAEKIVVKDLEIQNQKSIDDWKKELDVMSKCLSNPYAAQVFGYCSAGNILSIIMEFFPRGDLYKVLHTEKEKNPLSLLQRMRMARHTALSICNMHESGLMHRDIKSMNILVTEDYECKLTDFGCTKLVNERQIHNTANTGTPLWMAPEVLQGNYNFSADVYSIGLVLFEIFERKLPEFEPSVGVKLPALFMSASVVLPCLSRDPTQRPSASDVVKIVDKLIKSMLLSIKDLLQPSELNTVNSYINSIDSLEKEDLSVIDFLDVNLLALYNYLLTKSPKEMDRLIETAYSIDLSEDLGPFIPVNPPVTPNQNFSVPQPYVPPVNIQPYSHIPFVQQQQQQQQQQQYGQPVNQFGYQPQPQPYAMQQGSYNVQPAMY